jgi:hypothetical protein
MTNRHSRTELRPSEPPMPDPLSFFISWSTYGTWLPGDQRGWVEYRRGWQLPSPIRELEALAAMTEDACILDSDISTTNGRWRRPSSMFETGRTWPADATAGERVRG